MIQYLSMFCLKNNGKSIAEYRDKRRFQTIEYRSKFVIKPIYYSTSTMVIISKKIITTRYMKLTSIIEIHFISKLNKV